MNYEYLGDKTCQTKKDHCQQAKQLVQSRLRQMKNAWWERRFEDLQAAADAHDMKTFHHGLRAVYGPKSTGTTPVRAADLTTLLADKADILTRWAEHLNRLLNRESSISDEAIAAFPQLK